MMKSADGKQRARSWKDRDTRNTRTKERENRSNEHDLFPLPTPLFLSLSCLVSGAGRAGLQPRTSVATVVVVWRSERRGRERQSEGRNREMREHEHGMRAENRLLQSTPRSWTRHLEARATNALTPGLEPRSHPRSADVSPRLENFGSTPHPGNQWTRRNPSELVSFLSSPLQTHTEK